MKSNSIVVTGLALTVLVSGQAFATQKIISGVPNYDQDIFPIDQAYGSTNRGDCVPVACTMLHGYYDANGWPRLIPYGGNSVIAVPSNNPAQPYPGNAWGIDTVVRTYKYVLNYTPESGVYFPVSYWTWLISGSPLGDAIVAVTHYFEPGASFSRDDDDVTWPWWSSYQSYLNANMPLILVDYPKGAIDSYKWEGSSILQELDGGHCVCAVGWSDDGGRWLICNMGWLYSTRAWFNFDGGDDWYISCITPGGSSSGEDDDAYEDNDTISTAWQISPGTINNLRCLDTWLAGCCYSTSYGDWYKVNASAGQSLSVTISFINANGNLDLRVYGPSQTAVGSSTGTNNSESVSVSCISAGYYYIFVYGYNNAQNQNYSLTVSLVSPPALGFSVSGNKIILSWPTNAPGFNLESSTSVPSTNWSSVPDTVFTKGDKYTVTNTMSGPTKFYRLKK